MKNLLILLLTVTLLSCENSSSKADEENEVEQNSNVDGHYEMADMFIQFDAEKIGLLSVIKDVPQEKTTSVLRDYLAQTFSSKSFMLDKNPEYVVKLVDSIANKNNLSRKVTASIIFSYTFEMITRDEIIDEYSTEREEYLSQ